MGGGIAGLSVAWHLALAGCEDVLVLEADDMLGTGSTAHAVGGIRRQTGDPVLTELAGRSLSFYERFEDRMGRPVDLRQDGYLFVAADEARWSAMQARAERDRAAGTPVDTLTPRDLSELMPALRTDDLLGGTFCAEDGFLDPAGAAQGFAEAAKRRGVRIRTGVRVPSPEALEARVVVVATGPAVRSWTGLRMTVAKRHVFALTPCEALPYGTPMVLTDDPPFYAVAEPASVLVSPAETAEVGLDTRVEQAALEVAMERAAWRVPALAECGVRRGWAGLRVLTEDGRPAVGFHPQREGLFVMGGFNGKGVMLAPALGALAADLITGAVDADDPLAAALSPARLAG